MATVKLPTQLRSLSDGASEVPGKGATVREIIDDLEVRHPGMKNRLLDDSGSIRRFVNIYVEDEDVRFLKGLETEVPAEGRISIIPAVAGGSGAKESCRVPKSGTLAEGRVVRLGARG